MVIIKIILIANIILCLAVLVSFKRISTRSLPPSNQILFLLSGFLLYHLVYVLHAKMFFPDGGWIENSAPFGLAYGPFVYLCTRSYVNSQGLYRKDLFYFLPYILTWVFHIGILVVGVDYHTSFAEIYLRVLYKFIGLQFIGYGAWSIYLFRNKLNKQKIFYHLFLIAAIVCVLIFGVIFINIFLKVNNIFDEIRVDSGGIMMYTFVFVLLLFLLLHVITLKKSLVINQDLSILKPSDLIRSEPKDLETSTSPRYEKSRLPEVNLDWYESRLDHYMKHNQPWKRLDLNLQILSSEVNIPPHHLTQLLNLRKEVNFNEYLNVHRVEYACQLLQKNEEFESLEDVGYQSGFNSKTSFYRWFKKLKNMTPLEYRELHQLRKIEEE